MNKSHITIVLPARPDLTTAATVPFLSLGAKPSSAQESLLEGCRGPHGMLGTEPRLAVWKANGLSCPILSLQLFPPLKTGDNPPEMNTREGNEGSGSRSGMSYSQVGSRLRSS